MLSESKPNGGKKNTEDKVKTSISTVYTGIAMGGPAL